MNFGQDYSRSYDDFYRNKDYSAEARFVSEKLAAIIGHAPLNILDIGCGTALHAAELAAAGCRVTGIDSSADMLARAEERKKRLPLAIGQNLSFMKGDARNFRTGCTYDAVISLFHVMSYMADEGAFNDALASARAHLTPGGAILFDFWYGPAVLADPPKRRDREVELEGRRIRRITNPHWDRARDVVRIEFDVIESDAGGKSSSTHEEHPMRYFFEDGLRRSLVSAGFAVVEIAEWLTGKSPNEKSFGVYALARAV